MKAILLRFFAALFAAGAIAANAGGPYTGDQVPACVNTPLKYAGAGSITFNYDLGTLGARTNLQAAAIVNAALATWTNVPTATVTLSRGVNMPVDVNTSNYTTYYSNFSDAYNPVIYDDGSLTNLILGPGSSATILGFAGSAYNGACNYVGGRAVINGGFVGTDALFTTVITHELGHFIGLDHTQLDSVQGLAPANYPLMYPLAARSAAGLHEDDAAAISALYPDATVSTTYGTLTGTFVTAGGAPLQGANIWAQNTTTNQLFSVVSDYLLQGTGYFKLLLPPGTYTLHAEAIDTSFTDGSGVGPYSGDLFSPSFQPPFYSLPNGGGTAMTPVTMAGTINILAGCSASVTFRINGTSVPGATCGTPSQMVTPANGSTFAGSSVTFTWDAGTGTIADRYLTVGTTPGGAQIYGAYQGALLTRTVTGIPTNGSTIYVGLQSFIGGAWQTRSYTYTAVTILTPTPSVVDTPTPGTTLAASATMFGWTAGSTVTARTLSVGSTLGGSQYYGPTAQGSALFVLVTNLPTDGSTVYVRLTQTVNGGAPQTSDYTYTAVTLPQASTMTSPANGTTLAGASQAFQWTAGVGVTERYFTVGTALGGSDVYGAYQGAGVSRTVTGIPTNGATIYVRLMSYIGGGWVTNNYTYTAANLGGPPPSPPAASNITSPTQGSTLPGASVTFQWDAGSGVAERYFMVGTAAGASDVYGAYQGAGVSRTVSNVPTNGATIYVRLMSYVSGSWISVDRTYMAANLGGPPPTPPSASSFTSPAAGSTLVGSSVTFQWDAGGAVAERYFMVGSTMGASDIYAAYQGAALSHTVSGIPTDGRTIYVRLMSYVNGSWITVDRTFMAASGGGPPPATPQSDITSPAPSSTLAGTSVTFSWTAGTGVAERYLMVGTTSGGSNIYAGYQGAGLSKLVTGLPTGSVTVYVRLMSYISGMWVINNYTYTSAP